MPPKQTALQSHVRTLEYTTESNMEKGKPYLFTTENRRLIKCMVEVLEAGGFTISNYIKQ